MRVCNHCGRPLQVDSRFCPFCGVINDPDIIARQAGFASSGRASGHISSHARYARLAGFLFFVPFNFIVAVILATIALTRIAQSDGRLGGRDQAITGIMLALVSSVFQGFLVFLLANAGIIPLSIPQRFLIDPNATPQAVENEMRVIAMALERHRDANYEYPKPAQYSDDLPNDLIAYLRRVYRDPYRPDGTRAYRYNASEDKWWILASVGPDLEPDIDVSLYEGKPEDYPGRTLTYDPTNGVTSPGDLWIAGPFSDYKWFDQP